MYNLNTLSSKKLILIDSPVDNLMFTTSLSFLISVTFPIDSSPNRDISDSNNAIVSLLLAADTILGGTSVTAIHIGKHNPASLFKKSYLFFLFNT